MSVIQNPILPGFYPDPSLCRVGDDFYLVTSSFSFFPGLPVFHSRDLVHWHQLGHVISRPTQLHLNGRRLSGGLWAPTIRFHDGRYYVICTHSDGGGDFVCTAENPAGPWSYPRFIECAPGIDPSLFWDDDGSCWMTGNDWSKGYCYLWACRFDPEACRLLGEPKELWRGALKDAHAPEAPHLYRKDGYYYLLIAEGGTEFFHAVTVARAEHVLGPYVGYPGNPILTHRAMGRQAAITCTGHADLVELRDGSWYMACLACRPVEGYHLILGRETFLAPVTWEEGWPVVHSGVGRLTLEVPAPALPSCSFPPVNDNDWFSPVWNHLGCGQGSAVTIQGPELRLRCVAAPIVPRDTLETPVPIAFYGRRQQQQNFSSQVQAVLPALPGASCGLIVLQNNYHALRQELVRQSPDTVLLRRVKSWYDRSAQAYREESFFEQRLPATPGEPFSARLSLVVSGLRYTFLLDDTEPSAASGAILGSETAGGYIGAYVGLFASGNGQDLPAEVIFHHFDYR